MPHSLRAEHVHGPLAAWRALVVPRVAHDVGLKFGVQVREEFRFLVSRVLLDTSYDSVLRVHHMHHRKSRAIVSEINFALLEGRGPNEGMGSHCQKIGPIPSAAWQERDDSSNW